MCFKRKGFKNKATEHKFKLFFMKNCKHKYIPRLRKNIYTKTIKT